MTINVFILIHFEHFYDFQDTFVIAKFISVT